MSTPKARQGEALVCSKGHRAGYFTADAVADEPISSEVLLIDGDSLPGADQGWRCKQCAEPVAVLEDDERWRVRTAGGWVS